VGRGKDAYSLGKRKGRGNRKKNTVFQYVWSHFKQVQNKNISTQQ
jgi:hypothetical protein